MIVYTLAGLHEDYRVAVPGTFDALQAAYPRCPLRRVMLYRGLYRGAVDDRSLANADVPGEIQLNAYWFADRPLEALRQEARQGYLFALPGSAAVMKWHGGMVEPAHLLAHEFGHVLSDVLPGYEAFARAGWEAATRAPAAAVSGYALAGHHEWFGEAFAAMWLKIDHPSALAVQEFIGRG